MYTLEATFPNKAGYPLFFGSNILGSIGKTISTSRFSKVFFLVGDKIPQNLIDKVVESLKVESSTNFKDNYLLKFNAEEQFKTLETVEGLYSHLSRHTCDRKSLIINMGGGCATDIAGFVAASYARGIPFVQIPTTTLAQADASIGGKVGVNFNGIKNQIGAFSQPIAVFIDSETVNSLPDDNYWAGFAEIIKHGVIKNPKLFSKLQSTNTESKLNAKDYLDIMKESCAVKLDVVRADEREFGIRKLLNFGHTIGHAVESYALKNSISLLHGEAVAIGMVAECVLAESTKDFSSDDTLTVKNILSKYNLPITHDLLSNEKTLSEILKLTIKDKKNSGAKISFSLPRKIGAAEFDILLTLTQLQERWKSIA